MPRAATRIVLYMPSLSGGGAQRSMINLARGFAARGMEVDLVVSTYDSDFRAEVPEEVNLVTLGARRVASVVPRLALHIRQRRPDIVMSCMYRANLVALGAVRLSRHSCSTFVVVQNTTTQEMAGGGPGLKSRVKNQVDTVLMRRWYPEATGIVCISEGVAQDLAALCRIDREPLEVIYNPIEFEKIQALAAESVEHPWLDEDVPVLLAAGRLSTQKDYPTMLQALANIVRGGRNVRLLVLGKGELQREVEELIERLGLAENVDLLGFISNPFPYMKRADLFVLSSAWEGLGNVLIEAMALGTPVVSTDCPFGPAEIMKDGELGPLVDVGDHKALGEAIVSALDAPVPEETLIERACEFDAAHIVEQYLEFMARLRAVR